jgi:hypothetical protein
VVAVVADQPALLLMLPLTLTFFSCGSVKLLQMIEK